MSRKDAVEALRELRDYLRESPDNIVTAEQWPMLAADINTIAEALGLLNTFCSPERHLPK